MTSWTDGFEDEDLESACGQLHMDRNTDNEDLVQWKSIFGHSTAGLSTGTYGYGNSSN